VPAIETLEISPLPWGPHPTITLPWPARSWYRKGPQLHHNRIAWKVFYVVAANSASAEPPTPLHHGPIGGVASVGNFLPDSTPDLSWLCSPPTLPKTNPTSEVSQCLQPIDQHGTPHRPRIRKLARVSFRFGTWLHTPN